MNSNDFDMDLERRLRAIGRAAPEAPASLDEAAREVTLQDRTRNAKRFGRAAIRPSGLRWLGAVAAAVAVVVLIAGSLGMAWNDRTTAGWTPRVDTGTGEWTGIEWHDISANFQGHFGGGWPEEEIVRWAHGFVLKDQAGHWWLSDDGISWHIGSGIPAWSTVAGAGERLLVINVDAGKAWTTDDGERLVPCTPGFDMKQFFSMASAKPGVVVVTAPDQDPASPKLRGPAQLDFSADGTTWTTVRLPADFAEARGVFVRSFGDGFLAIGGLEDPNGLNSTGMTGTDGQQLDWRYTQVAVYSADGLTWTKSPATSPAPALGLQDLHAGRLGMSFYVYHSGDGGQTWIKDAVLPEGSAPSQTVSDGTRIVWSTDGGGRFYLSEGDGNWTLLTQGGEVAHLPNDGAMVLLPRGILWISGSHVYFGEALAGIEPQGSIGIPVSPEPDPNAASAAPAIPASATPPPPTATPMPTPTHP